MKQISRSPDPRVLKSVFPGKYIQGEGVISQLEDLTWLFGKKSLFLVSPTAGYGILAKYGLTEADAGRLTVKFNGECTLSEVNRVADIIRQNRVEVMAGIGGGKTIDTAKIAADMTGIPVIVVPTTASTDAPCSGCAVLYSGEGIFESVYYQKMNPQVVLVDMNIMAEAPPRFLASGMGDALATWFEARSCDRTSSMNACGGYSTMAGLALSRLCYDTLLKYGKQALVANRARAITPALHHIVEANTLLSGIGFESSGLATAHSVHNGLTVLKETHAFLHGEKVAFGVLTGLVLTDASPEETETVYRFCEEIGLPVSLADLGVSSLTDDRLMQVASRACDPTESIHHEAGKVSPEMVAHAIRVADAIGRERKIRNV